MPNLFDRLPAVDSLFTEWDKPDSPGASLVIVHEGKVVYKQGYGSANLEYEIPITPSSIFHVASVSKQFAAFAAALLAHEGKLSLDDEVQKHVPELADFGQRITVRHLIHHTSGLRDQWEVLRLAGWRMDDVITQEQILQWTYRQRELNFAPGSEFLYSNTGYTLLAEIVARVSGQSFRQFTEERIFKPLGMSSTHFHDDHEEIVPGRVYSYKADGQGGFKKSVLSYANVGATSLFTTVEDLALWLLNLDNPVVGDAALMDQVHQPFTLTSGEVSPYAFGLRLAKHRGIPYVGHSGWDAGYKTYAGRIPEQQLGIAVLGNLMSFSPESLALKVAEAYLGDSVQWGPEEPVSPPAEMAPAITMSDAELSQYVGRYYSEELDIAYEVTVQDGGLLVSSRRREDVRFVPTQADRFREAERGYLKLAFHREGTTITTMFVDGGRVRNLRFMIR